jgi:hypothetical protein
LVPEAKMEGRGSNGNGGGPDQTRCVAEYIAAFADELAHLAKQNGLDPLAFILDMARLEADQVSKGMEG